MRTCGLQNYSLLGKRVGEMVIIFSTGEVGFMVLPTGGGDCMVTGRWGRGWVKW